VTILCDLVTGGGHSPVERTVGGGGEGERGGTLRPGLSESAGLKVKSATVESPPRTESSNVDSREGGGRDGLLGGRGG